MSDVPRRWLDDDREKLTGQQRTVIIIWYIRPGYRFDEGISIMVILKERKRSKRHGGSSEEGDEPL